MTDPNSKDNSSGYVPATDDNGIRKTFPTPEFEETRGIQPKYPWRTIPVGQCFEILYSDMQKKSVAPYASKMGKKLGKKFKIIDKPEYKLWLVACLPMDDKEAAATSSGVVEALSKTAPSPVTDFGFEKDKE